MISAVRFAVPFCCLLAFACGEQGEGERCDLRNNNNDCESSLECVALESLGVNSPGAVCCPAQGSAGAQDPVCQRRGDFDEPPAAPPPPNGTPEAGTDPPASSDSGTTTGALDGGPAGDAAASDSGTGLSGEAGTGDAGAEMDAGDAAG